MCEISLTKDGWVRADAFYYLLLSLYARNVQRKIYGQLIDDLTARGQEKQHAETGGPEASQRFVGS